MQYKRCSLKATMPVTFIYLFLFLSVYVLCRGVIIAKKLSQLLVLLNAVPVPPVMAFLHGV